MDGIYYYFIRKVGKIFHFKWQHIEFADGSNPYICTTEENFEWMKKRYILEPIKEEFWRAIGRNNMVTVKDETRGIIIRTGNELKYNEVIYGVYGESNDITFIMRDNLHKEDGICVSTEVVGFHYGKPTMELLLAYIGRLKAEF